jgi:enamine deaminase RidA (YjgF/YER057c/UK114 family)
MTDIKFYNPPGLSKPRTPFMQVARVKSVSEWLLIAGQTPTNVDGEIVGADDFSAQCVQTFANIEIALRSAGAGWGNVVQFTSYLVRAADIPLFAEFRRRTFPQMYPDGFYPPNTLAIIDRLAHEAYRLEIQAVAAI